ncbi:PTS system mannose/fructose/sorbose family transporter subunit IID [Eubacteriales bacterium OttesenSCG-928-N14]|nr:PTS system mannose/fructose/sorbose family transporter subunit IID [Eubacteriales bacterium OttesenSCG-928-N14]
MSKLTEGISKEETKQIRRMIRRNFQIPLFYSHVRQQGLGCLHSMMKYIEWLYPNAEDKEKRVAAMKRQSVFYNICVQINTLGTGLFCALEKEARDNPDFDPSTINKIKVAIMGPAAGIGDSFYQVIFRVLCASIAIPFALEGSVLGGLIFIGLYSVFHIAGMYICGFTSYKMGTSFVEKAFASGILPLITKAAGVMGMVMVGSMIAKNVKVPLSFAIVVGEAELSIMEVLDGIAPGLLSMGLSLLCFWLVRYKKVNINIVMLGIFVFAIIGALVGIF